MIRRLAHLSASRIPSATANSVQVMRMCDAFAGEGVAVTLLAERGEGALSQNDALAAYGCRHRFEIATYPDRSSFERYGKGIARTAVWAAERALEARLCLLRRPDCLLARSLRQIDRHRHALERWRVPFVLELHELPEDARAQARLGRLVSSPACLGLVCTTRRLAERILGDHPAVRGDAVLVAPNPADRADPTYPAAALEGDFRVGYVGSLYEGCGLDTVLDGLRGEDRIDVHVVGGTPAEIDAWRARYAAQPWIHFHGFVRPADVARYLRAFDLVVAPYRPDARGHQGVRKAAWMSPLKVIEAMACAKPVLCSDLPTTREILTDGETGLLLAPFDGEAWRAAILRLANEDELRCRLGTAAEAEWHRRFTSEGRAQRILDFIAARRAGRPASATASAHAETAPSSGDETCAPSPPNSTSR